MTINPNDAVSNPRGPKHRSLYSACDFIRPGEEEEYSSTLIGLMQELTPEGIMEETFASEIMGATWRLRRCRLVEEEFGTIDDLDFDPMLDPRTEKQQKSIDRARAQSHLILRRSLAELRRLQTDRARNTANAAGPEPKKTQKQSLDDIEFMLGLSDAQLRSTYADPSSFCEPAAPPAPAPSSFCKTPVATPRNAPCPCGSGAKFKRCCGTDAPPVLNRAA